MIIPFARKCAICCFKSRDGFAYFLLIVGHIDSDELKIKDPPSVHIQRDIGRAGAIASKIGINSQQINNALMSPEMTEIA